MQFSWRPVFKELENFWLAYTSHQWLSFTSVWPPACGHLFKPQRTPNPALSRFWPSQLPFLNISVLHLAGSNHILHGTGQRNSAGGEGMEVVHFTSSLESSPLSHWWAALEWFPAAFLAKDWLLLSTITVVLVHPFWNISLTSWLAHMCLVWVLRIIRTHPFHLFPALSIPCSCFVVALKIYVAMWLQVSSVFY